MRRFLSWLAMMLGVVTTLVGVVFAAMYVFEAIIKRIGDPDQSLVFWYLPILLLGVFCIVIGIRLLAWGGQSAACCLLD